MMLVDAYEVELGSSPCNEICGQSGYEDGVELQKVECRVFAAQIVRVMGPLPEGTQLRAKRNPYEDTAYYEVVYRCDDSDQAAVEYGIRLENGVPMEWDAEARVELEKVGYFERLEKSQKAGRNR